MLYTDSLRQIIQPGRIGSIDNGIAHIHEHESGAKLRDVYISGLSNDDFYYNADKVKGLDNLLCSPNGTRHCDAVLFTNFKNIKRAVFIEMKSTSFRSEKYELQLKGSEAMCHFLSRISSSFLACSEDFDSFTKHYVVLHKLSISKPTLISGSPPNKTPEEALELYVDRSNKLIVDELIID